MVSWGSCPWEGQEAGPPGLATRTSLVTWTGVVSEGAGDGSLNEVDSAEMGGEAVPCRGLCYTGRALLCRRECEVSGGCYYFTWEIIDTERGRNYMQEGGINYRNQDLESVTG